MCRSRLLIRFRITAPPLPLATTNPTLGGPSSPGRRTTTSPPLRLLIPSSRTLRKSRELRRDWYSGSESLPALVAAGLQCGPTRTRAHTVSEAVAPLPAPHLGLIGPLHGKHTPNGGDMRRLRRRRFLCQSVVAQVIAKKTHWSRKKKDAAIGPHSRNPSHHILEIPAITWDFAVGS
jgi:hypothetical protein